MAARQAGSGAEEAAGERAECGADRGRAQSFEVSEGVEEVR